VPDHRAPELSQGVGIKAVKRNIANEGHHERSA
jgi:hypothetical protein